MVVADDDVDDHDGVDDDHHDDHIDVVPALMKRFGPWMGVVLFVNMIPITVSHMIYSTYQLRCLFH